MQHRRYIFLVIFKDIRYGSIVSICRCGLIDLESFLSFLLHPKKERIDKDKRQCQDTYSSDTNLFF
ncbi:MAG: hypothetical protein Q8O99_05975 [bacterium]|nr:hypothetical protein [bacterium]